MNRRGALVAASLLAAVSAAQADAISGQGTWETTLQSRDIDGDGTADAFYDTSLDITWLANGNANGTMSFDQAVAWAAGLVIGGVDDWRLPDSTAKYGYNVGAGASELAHLFYETLGNLGSANDQGSPSDGFGLHNTANFVDLRQNPYWMTGPGYPGWAFSNYFGYQGGYPTSYGLRAIAVRNGDVANVATPVPEPGTYALMLGGLAALGLSRRRRDADRS